MPLPRVAPTALLRLNSPHLLTLQGLLPDGERAAAVDLSLSDLMLVDGPLQSAAAQAAERAHEAAAKQAKTAAEPARMRVAMALVEAGVLPVAHPNAVARRRAAGAISSHRLHEILVCLQAHDCMPASLLCGASAQDVRELLEHETRMDFGKVVIAAYRTAAVAPFVQRLLTSAAAAAEENGQKGEQPRVAIYSAHDLTLAALLVELRLNLPERAAAGAVWREWTPYASVLRVEVHRRRTDGRLALRFSLNGAELRSGAGTITAFHDLGAFAKIYGTAAGGEKEEEEEDKSLGKAELSQISSQSGEADPRFSQSLGEAELAAAADWYDQPEAEAEAKEQAEGAEAAEPGPNDSPLPSPEQARGHYRSE